MCPGWADERMELREKHSTDYFLSNHPGMYLDFPHGRRPQMEHYYCGFQSAMQMIEWFTTEEINLFNKVGFQLVIFRAADFVVGYSEAQIFFRRGEATILREMEIPTCLTST